MENGRRKPTVSNVRQKRRFLALITWYMDLKASLAGRGFRGGHGFENRENMNEWWARKKPVFWELEAEEKTDLDLRTSIKGYSVTLALNHAPRYGWLYQDWGSESNNENRKLVKNWDDCASYLVFKHYYTENKVILHGMKPAVSSYCVRSSALRRAAATCASVLGQGGHCESRKPWIAVVFCDVDGKGFAKASKSGLITWSKQRDVTSS